MQLALPQKGETVLVLGLGPIGIMTARLYTQQGLRVIGVDFFGVDAATLAKLGLEIVSGEDIFPKLHALLPEGASIIVDTTGSASTLVDALHLAHSVAWDEFDTVGTRYLIQGSYPSDLVLPFHATFEKEVTFLITRDARREDIRQGLELIAEKKLMVRDLASLMLPPEEAAHAYKILRDRDSGIQSIIFE